MKVPENKGIVGVLIRCQILSIASDSDSKLMFVNIKKTADGSGCSAKFPKKYGGDARDSLTNFVVRGRGDVWSHHLSHSLYRLC